MNSLRCPESNHLDYVLVFLRRKLGATSWTHWLLSLGIDFAARSMSATGPLNVDERYVLNKSAAVLHLSRLPCLWCNALHNVQRRSSEAHLPMDILFNAISLLGEVYVHWNACSTVSLPSMAESTLLERIESRLFSFDQVTVQIDNLVQSAIALVEAYRSHYFYYAGSS